MLRILSILATVVLLVSLVDSAGGSKLIGELRTLSSAEVNGAESAPNQERSQGMPNQSSNSVTAGSWAVFAMSDPSFTAFSKGLTGSDRFLDLVVTAPEWGSLFLEVLNCPPASQEPRGTDEVLEDWQDRYKERFRRAIPEYPMLARLWDIFIYVNYKSSEVSQLREECRRIRATTTNRRAVSALTKIMKACDYASKRGLGLLFVPD